MVCVLERKPRGPQDPHAPRLQAPGKAQESYSLRLGLCEGLLLSKEQQQCWFKHAVIPLPHIYRLQKDGYILTWRFKFGKVKTIL